MFNTELLTSPHMAVGNGQHLVVAALTSLAALCCISSHPIAQSMQAMPSTPAGRKIIEVPADGRCFFSCVYLQLEASEAEREEWYSTQRNATGFALDSKSLEREDYVVYMWFRKWLDENAHLESKDPMYNQVMQMFMHYQTPGQGPCHGRKLVLFTNFWRPKAWVFLS